jgi:hypothetical protein
MSKIKLTGESSGYVEISAGSNAGNNTLELPTSGTRLVASDTSSNVTVGGSLNVSGIATFGSSVGIGTDNPLNLLDILQDTGRTRLNRYGHIISQNHNHGTTNYWSIAPRDGGELDIAYGAPNGNGNVTADKVTITTDGNLGIGTDNPGVRLNVRQDSGELARFQINNQTSSGRIVCVGGTASYAGINFGDLDDVDEGRIRYYNDANNDAYQSMLFYTNNSERLRIGSAGQIGLGGANYGTARQVLKSNGSDAAPTWSDLYSFYFFGEQDTQQNNFPNATYTRLTNLGNYAINIGPSSIATGAESSGPLTIGADGAGYWFLAMNGGIDDIQNADFVQVVIGKNGSTSNVGTRVSSYSRAYSSTTNQVTDAGVSTIVNLDVGDVVRFYLYHQEGTADEHSEPSRCFAMGYKI